MIENLNVNNLIASIILTVVCILFETFKSFDQTFLRYSQEQYVKCCYNRLTLAQVNHGQTPKISATMRWWWGSFFLRWFLAYCLQNSFFYLVQAFAWAFFTQSKQFICLKVMSPAWCQKSDARMAFHYTPVWRQFRHILITKKWCHQLGVF